MTYTILFYILLGLLIFIALITTVVMLVFARKKQLKLKWMKNNEIDLYEQVKEFNQLKEDHLLLKIEKEKLEKINSDHLTTIANLEKAKETWLLKSTNFSEQEAKNELMKYMQIKHKKDLAKDYLKQKKEFDEYFQFYASNILVDTMQNLAEPLIVERSLFNITMSDDSLKGKIIGRDGRNKAVFENVAGVDLIVDRQQPIIGVSSPNPIRREIASLAMQRLIDSKNIDSNRIELIYEEEKNKFDQNLITIGKDVIENKLGFYDIDPELYPYIGRMKFRTSYGQNILTHSLECAQLAEMIATELNLDPMKAKKIAFFHDLGKTIDFESDLDHVEAGILLARKFNFDEDLINGIESHHNKVAPSSIYSALVKVVDTLSAARPGARVNSYDEYFKRVNELEQLCYEFEGVKQAYVIRSGRQLRVMVDANIINDDQLNYLGYQIKQKIENNELLGNYKIQIVMIKEKRISLETNVLG
ncbi:HDIG domain-containing protein [Ureaplasma miroungigenitalium]|uniref:Ribonuclease Y n=1 Tax=Ureaplasma miroungigenitalium TaxID=1042321 RepID=A0ABT3BN58_9BACT|nr:HDIG domain-containing metalloprotein [Ureaplasma miroungigenitalium]MCV3728673.1 HDIG domain-containing protein [Ureaplasma miroungigenitalium]MCV3734364.1 HDIG domain-containing protein [Ureaplasma miroungigenitalium]